MSGKRAGVLVHSALCSLLLLGMLCLAAPASNGRDWGDGWQGYRSSSATDIFNNQHYFWKNEVDAWTVIKPWGRFGCKCEPQVLQFTMRLYGADQTPSSTYRSKPAALNLKAKCRSGIAITYLPDTLSGGRWVRIMDEPKRKYLLTIPTDEFAAEFRVTVNRIYPAAPDTTILLDSWTIRRLWRAAESSEPMPSSLSWR